MWHPQFVEFVELVKKLCKNDKTTLNFGALPYRKDEIMQSHADTAGLRSLGWEPIIGLSKGLELTIQQEKREKS